MNRVGNVDFSMIKCLSKKDISIPNFNFQLRRVDCAIKFRAMNAHKYASAYDAY